MASDARDAFAAVHGAFATLGVRWYLFGAQAVIAHGAPRLTGDIDVTVDLGAHDVRSLVAALAAAGLSLRVSDPDDFVKRARVLPLWHEASSYGVDVLVAGPGLEEQFMARARDFEIEGLWVPVVCAEDLVAMKIIAGRPKDLEDVTGVIAARGRAFDARLARATLRAVERALDRSDLLRVLNGALARGREKPKRRRAAKKKAP